MFLATNASGKTVCYRPAAISIRSSFAIQFKMSFDNWFMFPISIAIATMAMTSGVGGAVFFVPILLLGLGLPPEVAIGVGLITEVFGFTSGVVAYLRRKLVDFQLAKSILVFSIPMATLGVLAANFVDSNILRGLFGVGLLAVAFGLLSAPAPESASEAAKDLPSDDLHDATMTSLTSAAGEVFRYRLGNKRTRRLVAAVGGFFMGMISTGLGELNSYFLLQKCKIPSKVAVATSVFTVAFTALVAGTAHFISFVSAGEETLSTVLNLVVFTVPGVIIGGQIGPYVATRISQHALEKTLGGLFVFVAILTLGQLFFT